MPATSAPAPTPAPTPAPQRIQWVDCARAIAIIAVIVCYCSEAAYPFSLEGIQSLSTPNELIAFATFSFGRIGVPFFLFMTGFLMLDRHYDAGCIKFWRTKLLKLLLCSEAWTIIYNIFLALWRHDPITPSSLLVRGGGRHRDQAPPVSQVSPRSKKRVSWLIFPVFNGCAQDLALNIGYICQHARYSTRGSLNTLNTCHETRFLHLEGEAP